MDSTSSERRFGRATAPTASLRELVEPVVLAFVPGALLGFQLAGLLFFLNPHWPFLPELLARASAFYGALIGGAAVVAVLPFTWGRPTRARLVLPWALVAVFALSSILHGAHASYFSYYLPAGINRRLIKAALWLALAAVVSFYTALLHSLRNRPYGLRSRLGFVVLASLAIYVLLERRVAFHPPASPAPRPSSVETEGQPALLVVGVASATLDAILPLAERGQLPFFATMLEEGGYARLESIEPTRPEPVWTSLATGKLPFRHGVLGGHRYSADFIAPGLEFRLLPVGLSFRHWGVPGGELPAPRVASRQALALWDITERLGFDSTVIGWPGSESGPAGSLATASNPDSLNLAQQDPVSSDPPEIVRGDLERFANLPPWASSFAQAVAREDRRRQTRALGAIQRASTKPVAPAIFLQLPGLEAVAKRSFGGYSAIEFDGRRGGELEDAAAMLVSYYSLVDELLEELWGGLPEPRWLVVASPSGIRVDRGVERLLATVWPQRRLLGRVDDAPDGLLLLRGPGVRPGQLVTDARVVDLAPTVLYGLGYPVARDLDGSFLASAFSEELLRRRPVTVVPSYETLSGRLAGKRTFP